MARFTVTDSVRAPQGKGNGKEKKANRLNRMRAFWAHTNNKTLYAVGTLLAMQYADTGMTAADVLVAGGKVEIGVAELEVSGRVLPLPEGFSISLANISKTWGCPACRSAHGSGVYPSSAVDSTLLAKTRWYYNPTTQELFTISATCLGDYVQALGALDRIVEVPALTAKERKQLADKQAEVTKVA